MRMLKVAARFGHRYEHWARQFLRSDFNRYDLILVMDSDNRSDMMYLALYPEQQEKLHMLREFDPQGGPHLSVPDPWYGGADGFHEVYDVVDRSVQGLLAYLENQ
jgi:protein-tyrosine phosphatase